MKLAGYIRVSSDEQIDGYSLSAQEKAIHDFASLRGWQVIHIYVEAGRSAKDDQRPQFQQMIQDAESGHFDVIAVHKLDRFSRSLIDVMTYLNQLDKIGVSFVSVTEDFDFSTPIGKVILAMLGAFAQWYLDNLSNEVRKGKVERARKGGWNGTLSYGYTTPQRLRDKLAGELSPEDKLLIEQTLLKYPSTGDTDAIPCPFDSPAVVLAYEAYATGQHTDKSIAELLNNHGYRISARKGTNLLSRDTVGNMLKNRFYLGETSYGVRVEGKQRQWIPGSHEAIITVNLFDSVQEIRENRYAKYSPRPSHAKRTYPLTPFLISLETGTKWEGRVQRKKRRYFRRKTDELAGRVIYAEQLESKIGDFLTDIKLPVAWQSEVKRKEVYTPPKYELDNLKSQLERLKKLFMFGDITEDEYIKESNHLKQKINQIEQASQVDPHQIIQVGEVITNIKDIWSIANLEEKEKLCQQLFTKIYTRDVEIVAIEPTPVLYEILMLGWSFGEDRERIRSSNPLYLKVNTTMATVRLLVS